MSDRQGLKTDHAILPRKLASDGDLFLLFRDAGIPADFLDEKERDQGAKNCDPFEGWKE